MYFLCKLNNGQNYADCLLYRCSKFTLITPIKRKLHWLLIKFHTRDKSYSSLKIYNRSFPQYLSDSIAFFSDTASASLSSVQSFFSSHSSRTDDGAFSIIAPKHWNKLPTKTSLPLSKRSPRTHLFSITFISKKEVISLSIFLAGLFIC